MAVKLANNAVAILAANLSPSDTSIALNPGAGDLFPTLGPGDWFPATIIKSTGEDEIVRVTARSGDVLTVVRAQEGKIARSFNAGDRVELRLTAGVIEGLNSQIADLILPPGFGPIPWSMSFEPPGWIMADARLLMPDTPYQALRQAYINDGFRYGQDGAGNPRVPDMRGVVPAGRDNMGGSAAGRITSAGAGFAGTVLGAMGGIQAYSLTLAQMPVHSHGASASVNGNHQHSVTGTAASAGNHSHEYHRPSNRQYAGYPGAIGQIYTEREAVSTGGAGAHTHSVTGTAAAAGGHNHTITIDNAGSGSPHMNVQPTIIMNYLVKT